MRAIKASSRTARAGPAVASGGRALPCSLLIRPPSAGRQPGALRSRHLALKAEQHDRPQSPLAGPAGLPESEFEREFLRRLEVAEREEEELLNLSDESDDEDAAREVAPARPEELLHKLLGGLGAAQPPARQGTAGASSAPRYDPLRDGPMRYLGYANEVGEALSAWLFRGGVPLSYAVAICYILTDTTDKWRRAGAAARARLGPGEEHASAVRMLGVERGLDTLVWHLLASLILPGMAIHYAVAAATRALEALPATGPGQRLAETLARGSALGSDAPLSAVSKAIPTLLGLVLIPLIARPIDRGVHALLDATLRPVLRKVLEGTGALRAGPGKEDGDRE